MTFYKSNRVNISVKVVLEPNLLNSRREVHLNNSPTNLWTIQLDNFINVLYLTLIKSFSLQTQLRHALEGFNNTKQIKKKKMIPTNTSWEKRIIGITSYIKNLKALKYLVVLWG